MADIRALVYEDLPAVLRLKRSCWQEETGGAAGEEEPYAQALGSLEHWFSNGRLCAYGAFEGAELCAAALFGAAQWERDGAAELMGLWTDALHRGQGLARALVLHGCEALMAQGVKTLKVLSIHGAPSQGFYMRLGFVAEQQAVHTASGTVMEYFSTSLPLLHTRLVYDARAGSESRGGPSS